MRGIILAFLLLLVTCASCYGGMQKTITAESYIETTFVIGENYVEWTLTEEFGYYEILVLEGG